MYKLIYSIYPSFSSDNPWPESACKTVSTQTEGIEDILLPDISNINAENSKLKSTLEAVKYSVENVKYDGTMLMLIGFSKL